MIEIEITKEWGYLKRVALQIQKELESSSIVRLLPMMDTYESITLVKRLQERLKYGYRFSREFFNNGHQCILYVTKEN